MAAGLGGQTFPGRRRRGGARWERAACARNLAQRPRLLARLLAKRARARALGMDGRQQWTCRTWVGSCGTEGRQAGAVARGNVDHKQTGSLRGSASLQVVTVVTIALLISVP